MKRVIIRELIWLIITVVLAIIIVFLILTYIIKPAESNFVDSSEQRFTSELFLLLFMSTFLAVYLIRVLVWSIKHLFL